MKIQEIRGNPCALVRPLRPVSSMAARARPISLAYAKHGYAETRNDAYQIGPRITHVDRVIIRSYFDRYRSGLPLEQQREAESQQLLARNGWLPSGLPKFLLPSELERKLSALPTGYLRLLIGSEVALIETAARRIVDVSRDVYAAVT